MRGIVVLAAALLSELLTVVGFALLQQPGWTAAAWEVLGLAGCGLLGLSLAGIAAGFWRLLSTP